MITTTQPITIAPGVLADKIAVSLRVDALLAAKSVGASAIVTGQRFHVSDDGTITPAGEPLRVRFADVFALASKEPAIAQQVLAIEQALEALVPLIGL